MHKYEQKLHKWHVLQILTVMLPMLKATQGQNDPEMFKKGRARDIRNYANNRRSLISNF